MTHTFVYLPLKCPHCEELKRSLNEKGYVYIERNLKDPVELTNSPCDGVFVTQAPGFTYIV